MNQWDIAIYKNFQLRLPYYLTLPPLEDLFFAFSYEPITGVLSRRLPGGKVYPLETHKAEGYLQVGFGGQMYLVARIIWKLQTGEEPLGEVDHINGLRDDNRWDNLRLVSHKENVRNKHSALDIGYAKSRLLILQALIEVMGDPQAAHELYNLMFPK